MDTASSPRPTRSPVCVLIAALIPVAIILFFILQSQIAAQRPPRPAAGPELGGVFILLPVAVVIALSGLGLSIAALVRRERIRWLAWVALLFYGLPILYGLQTWLGVLSQHHAGRQFREEWLRQHPEQR